MLNLANSADESQFESKLSQQCDELHRLKTMPTLAMLFILEVIYAGWSTMKFRCLDLKKVESVPFFFTSCVLQFYLGIMAIKDGSSVYLKLKLRDRTAPTTLAFP